ncbi:MAG: immunity 26/phosphotriesterase HocA family protein [Armatimonadota bacterium]|nr:immunity 26/phosphotriesterase HocA family protein [Armatimonadota bacterium]
MNLRVLKRSRKPLKPGDIFALQVKEGEYMFGRVIRVEEHGGPADGFILIYIYNVTSANKSEIPTIDKDNLLIPPYFTNKLPWSRGYFETIENRPLTEDDVLKPHCFWDIVHNEYRDEFRNVLRHKVEPCGVFGLGSFRTIDIRVSDALGIPQSEIEPDD